MDVATIAAGAAVLLTPYVKKAAEEFAGEAGRAVWGVAQRLHARLRRAFGGDDPAAEVLDRYDDEPEATQDELVGLLKERLAADPALAAEVAESLAEAKRAGSTVHVVQKVIEAERVVGAEVGRIRGDRSLRVEQDVQKSKDVLGVRIDEL